MDLVWGKSVAIRYFAREIALEYVGVVLFLPDLEGRMVT